MDTHFVGSVAQKALIVRHGKVLIVLDRKWELPGGRLHVNETPHEGLRRELREELGIEVKILTIHDVFSYCGEGDGLNRFGIVYHCELEPPNQEPKPDGRELKEIRWISTTEDLDGLEFFPFFRESIEAFLKQMI